MIRLDRSVVAAPADAAWRKQVAAHFADHKAFVKRARAFERLALGSKRRLRGFRAYAVKLAEFAKGAKGFPEVWVVVGASKELAKMTGGYCAYCQTDVASGQPGDVEHLRPKSIFPLHAYRWANWYYVCRACNILKGNKWPLGVLWVVPDRKGCDPMKRFRFAEDGTVRAAKKSDRGAQRTIEDFGLNRKALVKQRKVLIGKQVAMVRRERDAARELKKRKTKRADRIVRELAAAAKALRIDLRSRFGAAVSQCVGRELASRS